ncbi:MAG TPA: URC4/urg3 family protein [Polyangiaceae bacterium]
MLDADEEARYLSTARAVRERCSRLHGLAQEGKLDHWTLDEQRLPEIAAYVAKVTRDAHPDVQAIPYHGRYRHFSAGGVDRLATLEQRWRELSSDERLMSAFELVITSVLLDAGAGTEWSYRDADGRTYSRSEGLAVASFDWFSSGGLSDDADAPLSVGTRALQSVTPATLGAAFQVSERNPLLGLDGRASLLRRLGEAVRASPAYFGEQPRLGHFALALRRHASGGALPAPSLLTAVLEAFGQIWPGRETLAGRPLGDVWWHPRAGRVPFHKLSQWLSYSLCEPLEAAGVRVVALNELTGLAEYRNGGLFVDGGALVPKRPGILGASHLVSSEVVVEWRALTVCLLDRLAEQVRERLGLSDDELPLVRVLEGGTWRAGRSLAANARPGAVPPLSIESDGTVF